MVSSRALYLALVGAFYAERLLELAVSSRNLRRLRARGGVEHGRGHYGATVAFHALYPAAAALEVLALARRFPGAVGWAALTLVALAQALRWWCVATLGGRWTTRVVVVPGLAPVTSGPYRWLRHPNYLAVEVEAWALPLVHGAWLTAIAAGTLNALLLAVRIRAEERALGPGWRAAFGRRPRPGAAPERPGA
jgi:methyltransferase